MGIKLELSTAESTYMPSGWYLSTCPLVVPVAGIAHLLHRRRHEAIICLPNR
jgi:hypothetical protein